MLEAEAVLSSLSTNHRLDQLLFQGWLNTRPSTEIGIFTNLFERIFEDAYNFVVTILSPKMVTLQCDYIAQVRFFRFRKLRT